MSKLYVLIFGLFASFLLPACGTNKISQENLQIKNGASTPYKIGYTQIRGDGYYFLLEKTKDDSHWRVIEINRKPIARISDDQEILFISKDGELVQPAYNYKYDGSHVFSCMALGKSMPARYTPCDATRFVSIQAASTVARNIVYAPISLGLLSGSNRVIDVSAISGALQDTDLLHLIAKINSSQNRLQLKFGGIQASGDELRHKIKWAIKVSQKTIDNSGFLREPIDYGSYYAVDPIRHSPPFNSAKFTELPEKFSSPIEMISAINKKIEEIDAYIEHGLPKFFTLSCPQKQVKNFNITFDCLGQHEIKPVLEGRSLMFLAKIDSYSPGFLLPKYISENKAVQFSVENNYLRISNKTNDYLAVTEISCYVEDDIKTRKWANGSYLSLPPYSKLKDFDGISLTGLCASIYGKTDFQTIVIDKLKSKKINFGIAIKYRKTGDSADQTFFSKNDFSLEAIVAGSTN